MTKLDGLLEWFDVEDGSRHALLRLGGRTGLAVISTYKGSRQVEIIISLGSATGAIA
jgi:hypothetical protein